MSLLRPLTLRWLKVFEADSTEIVPNPNRSTLHSMQFDDGFRYATVRYRLLSINLSNI
jgi:hypothetical protein